jgi:hypothetical protein
VIDATDTGIEVSPGAMHRVFDDPRMVGGTGHLIHAGHGWSMGQHTLTDLQPGAYDLAVGVKKQDTRGIYQLALDGIDVGDPQDMYAPSDTYPEIDYGRGRGQQHWPGHVPLPPRGTQSRQPRIHAQHRLLSTRKSARRMIRRGRRTGIGEVPDVMERLKLRMWPNAAMF